MPVGDPGKESFRRAIIEFRNLHVVAGVWPLIRFRQELVGNDEFKDRGGFDSPTQHHMEQLLLDADRWRRRVTYNPDNKPLGEKIEDAIRTKDEEGEDAKATIGVNPFGGDDIQGQSGGLIDLPWALDGTDPDIPLPSQLAFKNGHGLLFLNAIDRSIVNWTRLNSRDRTRFITWQDSMRVYGSYQEILGFIREFGGNENRVDVAQVLPSDEPLGPTDSPNIRGESSGSE